MKTEIHIENLKCGGCASTIKKGISELEGITSVEVDIENSMVLVETEKESSTEIKEKLSKLGYPEVGDKNTVLHKAKSFVSCAVGRVNKD
ncbi:copper chaperone CopZ [Tenacibaculum adriaticum]|uniref:Copper chaperone CopZ n=1 Tax=Tenacibaculum adriaticum TaxID=413713 RepID=A0A5S5DWV2_9FLAO|nr:heavy-metal-associated domain-containing protein [Tenacibaculum adriaticum]TYQ00316.1 copper chaperone CopZ [Tenacibaculum adriaticum]